MKKSHENEDNIHNDIKIKFDKFDPKQVKRVNFIDVINYDHVPKYYLKENDTFYAVRIRFPESQQKDSDFFYYCRISVRLALIPSFVIGQISGPNVLTYFAPFWNPCPAVKNATDQFLNRCLWSR